MILATISAYCLTFSFRTHIPGHTYCRPITEDHDNLLFDPGVDPLSCFLVTVKITASTLSFWFLFTWSYGVWEYVGSDVRLASTGDSPKYCFASRSLHTTIPLPRSSKIRQAALLLPFIQDLHEERVLDAAHLPYTASNRGSRRCIIPIASHLSNNGGSCLARYLIAANGRSAYWQRRCCCGRTKAVSRAWAVWVFHGDLWLWFWGRATALALRNGWRALGIHESWQGFLGSWW